MKLKKLPIGISTLRTIIDDGYAYVDKTYIALDLINSGQYYFLSRPRRFGKSLFLDTLRTIYEGDKECFKGLYIYDKYDFKKYPVIHISFGFGFTNLKGSISNRVTEILNRNEKTLSVKCDKYQTINGYFEELIMKAYEKYNEKVVILIDEYDKPILDNIESPERAIEIRDELRDFYAVIKDSDRYIKFVFITGVSKFSKVSLFSGLNNLDDITLDNRYATICGYTQGDVETVFREHLKGQDFDKIRRWYNGYKWLGEAVYNPFDILLFISKGYDYRSYWFSTGTPTFLLKLIEANNYHLPNLENVTKDDEILDSFDVGNIELETLMWQTGYLTIEGTEDSPIGKKYRLTIPNHEVRVALYGSIADYISRVRNRITIQEGIYEALLNADMEKLQMHLKSLYASIPYTSFTNNRMYEHEGYYVNVFYAYIKGMGIEVAAEDITSRGRIDITVKMPQAIYVIEFKTDGAVGLEQIKGKGYHEKYLSEDKAVYIIAIEFDIAKRNITDVRWEQILSF